MATICEHKEVVSLEDVANAFETAENAIKQNERLTLAIPLPAVNQLRYAAYHLLKVAKSSVAQRDREYHLERALGHCIRARFDALDGIIYSCLDFITAFQKLCRSRIGLEAVYPDYRSDYDTMADVQDRFVALRKIQDMTLDDLTELDAIASRVVAFKRKVLRMKIKVEPLECKMGDEDAIVASQQFLIPFVTTILGTLTGLIGLLLAVWSQLPESLFWRCVIIGAMLSVIPFGIFGFYLWAVKHMLTAAQRKALESKYHFKF